MKRVGRVQAEERSTVCLAVTTQAGCKARVSAMTARTRLGATGARETVLLVCPRTQRCAQRVSPTLTSTMTRLHACATAASSNKKAPQCVSRVQRCV